jgi:hypothetical protein
VRPGHSAQPEIRLTASGTDLITILRCFLSFKTVVTSRNIIVFKIKFSRPKNGYPSHAHSLVPRAASWPPAPRRDQTPLSCSEYDAEYDSDSDPQSPPPLKIFHNGRVYFHKQFIAPSHPTRRRPSCFPQVVQGPQTAGLRQHQPVLGRS